MGHFSIKEIFGVTIILFSVIDILGTLPIVLDLRKRPGGIHPAKATIVAMVIMIAFLFIGESILGFFGVDVASFAVAGALIMFLMGIEMVLNIEIFKADTDESSSSSIVPLAFPLIAGPGTMTTLISLRAEYAKFNVLTGIVLNLIFVYLVLKFSRWISAKLGPAGANILRKVFGIILLAIAIKLFKLNLLG